MDKRMLTIYAEDLQLGDDLLRPGGTVKKGELGARYVWATTLLGDIKTYARKDVLQIRR